MEPPGNPGWFTALQKKRVEFIVCVVYMGQECVRAPFQGASSVISACLNAACALTARSIACLAYSPPLFCSALAPNSPQRSHTGPVGAEEFKSASARTCAVTSIANGGYRGGQDYVSLCSSPCASLLALLILAAVLISVPIPSATASDGCEGMPSACGKSGDDYDDALCEYWEALGCVKERSAAGSSGASGPAAASNGDSSAADGSLPGSSVSAPGACEGMPSACGKSGDDYDDALCEYWEALGCVKERSAAGSSGASGPAAASGGGSGASDGSLPGEYWEALGCVKERSAAGSSGASGPAAASGGGSGASDGSLPGSSVSAPGACEGMPSACGKSGDDFDDALCEYWEALGCVKERSAAGGSGASGPAAASNGGSSGAGGKTSEESDDSESPAAAALGGSASTQTVSPEVPLQETGDLYLDFLRTEYAKETDPDKRAALLAEIEKYTGQ